MREDAPLSSVSDEKLAESERVLGTTTSINTLVRLGKPVLILMCTRRKLRTDGTRMVLAQRLFNWVCTSHLCFYLRVDSVCHSAKQPEGFISIWIGRSNVSAFEAFSPKAPAGTKL